MQMATEVELDRGIEFGLKDRCNTKNNYVAVVYKSCIINLDYIIKGGISY